jgi:hypothetical protein
VALPAEALDCGGEVAEERGVVAVVVEERLADVPAARDVMEDGLVDGTSTPATELRLRRNSVAEVSRRYSLNAACLIWVYSSSEYIDMSLPYPLDL